MRDHELAYLHLGLIVRDPDAFVAFEAALRPLARGMLRKLGLTNEDADEVWNDAFLIAIEHAETWKPLGAGLRRMTLTVAHRRGVDRIRREVRMPRVPIEVADVGGQSRDIPLVEATLKALRGCVDRAPGLFARVMEMASRGLTAKEIGRVLDMSEANAAKIRQRARVWFADCLEGVI
jgi:DNA-directed RNA polymerase specialized sigma24 family protein